MHWLISTQLVTVDTVVAHAVRRGRVAREALVLGQRLERGARVVRRRAREGTIGLVLVRGVVPGVASVTALARHELRRGDLVALALDRATGLGTRVCRRSTTHLPIGQALSRAR